MNNMNNMDELYFEVNYQLIHKHGDIDNLIRDTISEFFSDGDMKVLTRFSIDIKNSIDVKVYFFIQDQCGDVCERLDVGLSNRMLWMN